MQAYVFNFKQAIRSYYKGASVTDYLKRQHFYEALSGQQRLAIGCSKIGGTYEEMKEAFISVYEVSLFDKFGELFSLRMREGETVASFANHFKGLLLPDNDVNWSVLEYIFVMKLPTQAWTQKVKDWFDEKKSFKDLSGECNKALKHALSDQSSKHSRAAVNSVQEDDEEAEQEEDEPTAVNLVNGGKSQQWKNKRTRTDQGSNIPPDAKGFAAMVCQPHQRFGSKAWRCLGNGCIFEKMPGFTTKRPTRGQGQGNGRGRARN